MNSTGPNANGGFCWLLERKEEALKQVRHKMPCFALWQRTVPFAEWLECMPADRQSPISTSDRVKPTFLRMVSAPPWFGAQCKGSAEGCSCQSNPDCKS